MWPDTQVSRCTRDSAVNRNLLSHPRRRARAGNTCCCRSHLPSVKNRRAYVRVIHTQMIKFSRLHATTVMPRISAQPVAKREREGNQYLHWTHKRHSVGRETLFSGDLLPLYRVIFPFFLPSFYILHVTREIVVYE